MDTQGKNNRIGHKGRVTAILILASVDARKHSILSILFFASLLIFLPNCTTNEPTGPPNGQDTTVVVDPSIDTTTHVYTWQSFEIGNVPSSSFYSVSAVDDDNAYAVGSIYLRDTTVGSTNFSKFNAAKWNGTEWSLEVISPHRPGVDTNLIRRTTLWSVWGEAPNNYTFTSASQIVYYDGSSAVTDLSFWAKPDSQNCRRIWGNEAQRWFYGNSGWITRGKGRIYTKQPRLTTSLLTGMCSNTHEAWAVAGTYPTNERTILYYHQESWKVFNDSLTADELSCTEDVWCDERGLHGKGFVGLVGSTVYFFDSTWQTLPSSLINTGTFFYSIHGTASNNVFAVGRNGIVVHYNGNNWKAYPELFDEKVWYYDAWTTGSKVFVVGSRGGSFTNGYITIGTRIE